MRRAGWGTGSPRRFRPSATLKTAHGPLSPEQLAMTRNRPPSVSSALETRTGRALVNRHGHERTVAAIRNAISRIREAAQISDAEDVAEQAAVVLDRAARSRLRPLWNLTGTILHTNLGRALLSKSAVEAACAAMARPIALEYDLEKGGRGERDEAVCELLLELTGAGSAVLVNNNAAAVMLVLDTFARGGEVIVSRGELIEIGGAFRLPDIMERSGARLREVGTTNRTHFRDYESAISEHTRLIMKVHPSNYRIEGFAKAVAAAELVPLARSHGIPLINDLGSGTLTDVGRFGLPREPTVREAVAEGADIVTFSGDKLLGGPQAGFAIGRADLVNKLKANPIKRTLRLDKVRLAALEATLCDYRRAVENPTLRVIGRDLADIASAAERIAPKLRTIFGGTFVIDLVACESQVGSGASPTATLPSVALAIRPPDLIAADALAGMLRSLQEPVIGRIREGRLLLDLRCLMPEDEPAFLASVSEFTVGES